CRPRPPESRSPNCLPTCSRMRFQSPIPAPTTIARVSSRVWRIFSPPGPSPTPVLPALSVRMTRLRVKNGPCAPDRFSSMLSCPATGTTFMSVTRGAPVLSLVITKSSGGSQHHTLDRAGDEQIADHGNDGMGEYEQQRHVPAIVGGGEDIADADRRENPRGVAKQVENAARQAGGFARRRIAHHRPAQGRHALAEEG